MTAAMFLLLCICLITEAGREICFKYGAGDLNFFNTLKKPMIWLGISCWIIELIAWTNVVAHIPLGIAFPLMSLVYVIVLLGGKILFNEPVNKRHAMGAFCITIGVACVGATGV